MQLATPRRVIVGSLVGVVIALVLLWMRDPLIHLIETSPTIQFGVIQGINLGHVTTLSNTILILLAWLVIFVFASRQQTHASEMDQARLKFFFLLWLAQNIWWWQSVVSGFSMIPDHFIYTVWLLSVLSTGFLLLHPELFMGIKVRLVQEWRCLQRLHSIFSPKEPSAFIVQTCSRR
jgi:hypothetical protein